MDIFNFLPRFLDIFAFASDRNDVAVGRFRRQVDLGVGFVANVSDGGATFADDILVELLEDVYLCLVVVLFLLRDKKE